MTCLPALKRQYACNEMKCSCSVGYNYQRKGESCVCIELEAGGLYVYEGVANLQGKHVYLDF